MKRRIYGGVMQETVPDIKTATGRSPVVTLQHGLKLDDGNFFESPVLILGNVGSGKTTLMNEIMEPVMRYADLAGDNVVVFAAKPELLRYARPQDPIVGINSTEPGSCWNIFEELSMASSPELRLREIASALFAEQRAKTLQTFFPDAAREIFFQTARYFYDFSVRTGKMVTNEDLVHFLETTPIRTTDGILGWIELAKNQPGYFSMVRDYIGNGGEQGHGVLAEIRNLIANTFFGSFRTNNGLFSATGALRQKGERIFLYYDYAQSAHSTLTIYKILIDLLLKEAMRTDSDHRTWFFLDEASLLPRSDTLTDALSLGRDPGDNRRGGVRILMSLQSARLMTHHYTQKEAEILLSLFPNVISMRVTDPMSRAVIAERYGKARYQYSYSGIGGREHFVDCEEDVVSDYHFSLIDKKGQAIMSLPAVSKEPFFYDGYRG